MKFGSDYIKKLIADAHTLLEQDDVNDSSKTAIENCLKSIQDYEKLNTQNKKDVLL